MDWEWEITDHGHIKIDVTLHGARQGSITLRPSSILSELEEDLETAEIREDVEGLVEWRLLATSLLGLSSRITAALNDDGRV